ncbi:MAG: thioredoxin domain-containing protein, partial [Gammaproteobacteria bacterium]
QAWQVGGDELFRRVAKETAEWVMREMQSPEGGYYATLDADSEGEEGRFYAWTREEVRAAVDEEDYELFARRYGLDGTPNFEHKWHLHTFRDLHELAREFSVAEEAVQDRLDGVRRRLFDIRQERVHPGRDEKILTSWNGLMIKGMAVAGGVLGEPAYLASAERALDFIHANLWHDGRLRAVYKDGRARFPAYLDDYAFLMDGILALLQARWRDGDLDFAIELAEALLDHFQDPNHGGFFFTADDHERLIHRPKPLTDEATPSGNGIAATVLGRLGHMLGESRYLDAAERTLRAAWSAITNLPYAHDALLSALEDQLYPPQLIVLRGERSPLKAWQARVGYHYAPRRMVLAIPSDAADLRGSLAHCAPRGEICAYVCSGTQCSAPITTLGELESHLIETEVSA